MAKVTSITEHYQHFLRESKEGFWGDLYGQTKLAWKGFFEQQRNGSATGIRERDVTSAKPNSGRIIATATMNATL